MSLFGFWILFFIVIYNCLISAVKAFQESVRFRDNETNCISYLMSPKYLTDDQFSASSYAFKFRPSAARLIEVHSQSGPDDGNAWCPNKNIHSKPEEWIEVDFRRMVIIKRIYTMGRADGNFQQFTPQILIKYTRSINDQWRNYVNLHNESILTMNTDARTKLRSNLRTIIAKRIRIYPINSISSSTKACLKFAFLGCFIEDDAVSYEAPQGDLITISNISVDLRDHIYDGQISGTLQNGLGLLMDNIAWRNKFDLISNVNDEKEKIFTGWSCAGRHKGPFIIIRFHFEQERDFMSLTLYSVKDLKHNIYLSGMITVTVSKGDRDNQMSLNATIVGDDSDANELRITIQLNHLKGYICSINITCGLDNFILLSEIEIKSVRAKSIRPNVANSPVKRPAIHYFNTTDKYTTSLLSDKSESKISNWKQQDITAMILVILIILLLIFVIGMAALCYKLQRSRRSKLTKKLELVAQCNNQNMRSQTPGTVFTIQSKTPANTTNQQPKYFSETKTTYSAAYSGSQPSDGVYASWPNTDEDPDVATIDKEEEKCLLSAEVGERSSMKEYATYQCSVNPSGANEYILTDNSLYRPTGNTRSSSIVTTIPNLSTLSVPLLKIVASYETPKTTPIVTFRSNKKLSSNNVESMSYQHLLNYRGSCGEVDFRYHSPFPRIDQSNSDSNIRVIPISSLIPIQQVIRGEFGTISVCTMLIEGDHQTAARYFVKNLNIESNSSIKSNFIMDLKILSSINCSNVVKLESIAVDSDMSNIDLVSVIKSTRFYLIMDYLNGYNLKDFLRSTYYSNVSQDFKLTQSMPYSQISLSSLMIIITQIANGMKHLEELGLTHRDLACRNCVIDLRMHVKIYPGGLVTTKPNEDYCSMEILSHLVTFPVRWMAPESIIAGIFTTKSDIWSFAVTLWEIFTLCSLMPYGSLTNEALLDLMSHRNNTPRLPCPQNCPKDIYDLMNRCWNWDESVRPKFIEVHKFLQFKTSNSTSQAQIILPAPPPDDHTS